MITSNAQVTGGIGDDNISSKGLFPVEAGAGNDTLTSSGGKSCLYGNKGDDSFFTNNNYADYAIRGGPRYDIATVDDPEDLGTGVIDSINVVTYV